MKKNKRKKQIRLTIGFVVACIVIAIGATIFSITRSTKQTEEKGDYQVAKIEKSAPLLFNGVAQPKESRTFTLDPTLGTLETIHVKNNQQVKAGEVIATYKNETIADQVTQQEQGLNKLNMAVSSAQNGYNSAVNKKNELANQYNQVNKILQEQQTTNPEAAK